MDKRTRLVLSATLRLWRIWRTHESGYVKAECFPYVLIPIVQSRPLLDRNNGDKSREVRYGKSAIHVVYDLSGVVQKRCAGESYIALNERALEVLLQVI